MVPCRVLPHGGNIKLKSNGASQNLGVEISASLFYNPLQKSIYTDYSEWVVLEMSPDSLCKRIPSCHSQALEPHQYGSIGSSCRLSACSASSHLVFLYPLYYTENVAFGRKQPLMLTVGERSIRMSYSSILHPLQLSVDNKWHISTMASLKHIPLAIFPTFPYNNILVQSSIRAYLFLFLIPILKMRFLLSLLALSVETGLVLGTPYERNGIIYDGRPEPRKARHEVRDLAAEAAALDAVASMPMSLDWSLEFADLV